LPFMMQRNMSFVSFGSDENLFSDFAQDACHVSAQHIYFD